MNVTAIIEREVRAHHEAGHAVAAWVFGMPIERVTIEQEGDVLGHVLHNYGADVPNITDLVYGDDDDKRQVVMERKAIVSLAGELAQRRFRPDSVYREGGRGDRLSVHHVLDILAGEGDQELRDAWWRLLELRAERLIERNWYRVEWLATVLLEKGTLDADAVDEAIADVELPIEYRGKQLSLSERLEILAKRAAP